MMQFPTSQRITRILKQYTPSIVSWCAFLAVLATVAIIGIRIPDRPITESDISSQEQRLNASAIKSIRSYRDSLTNRPGEPSVVPDPFNR